MTTCTPDATDLALPNRFAHLGPFVRPLALVEADVDYCETIDTRRFDLVLRTTATGGAGGRGILARARTPGTMLTDDLLDAVRRDIIAADTRYPGWLTRLSSVRYE